MLLLAQLKDLPAGVMDRGADVRDGGLEDAVRRRVGDHQRGQICGVLVDLDSEVGHVDVALLVTCDDDNPHAGHDRTGGVGPVRTARDQADISLTVTVGPVVRPDGQKTRELTL